MRKVISIITTTFILIGCGNRSNDEMCKKKLQNALKIEISDSIEITNYETSYAIGGDYSESFNVHFQKDEFYKVIKELELQKCSEDTTIYCYEIRGDYFNFISISFYPDELLVNYFHGEE